MESPKNKIGCSYLANITFTETSSFLSFSSGTFKKSNSVATVDIFPAFRFLTQERIMNLLMMVYTWQHMLHIIPRTPHSRWGQIGTLGGSLPFTERGPRGRATREGTDRPARLLAALDRPGHSPPLPERLGRLAVIMFSQSRMPQTVTNTNTVGKRAASTVHDDDGSHGI
jgi:hypothetical protein